MTNISLTNIVWSSKINYNFLIDKNTFILSTRIDPLITLCASGHILYAFAIPVKQDLSRLLRQGNRSWAQMQMTNKAAGFSDLLKK